MVTNINKSNTINGITYSKNVAIVAKQKTNKDGITETTYVEFANLKDRNLQAVLKCVICGILSDESITNELKAAFATLENEEGKKAAFAADNTVFATAFVKQRENDKKALFTPPTFRRLIASFSEDYQIGYSNDEGKFTHVLKVEGRCNLRALLLVNAAKIEEFAAANSETRRAIVHTLAKAAVAASKREGKYFERYNSATAKPEAKPEAAKGKDKAPKAKKQAKPEAAKA